MAEFALKDIYKVGSSWTFIVSRKDQHGIPIDLTGLSVRAMFRMGSVDGPVVVTLTDADGIIVDAIDGSVNLSLTPTQTALFLPGSKIVFDVEMARTGYSWHSPTYRFKTEAEVTRG